jgi:aspartate-semialdehyde dehydrogenase
MNPNLYRVAIVGASSLKGKELSEVLNERAFPAYDIKLMDDDQALGKLEAVAGEVTFVQSVTPGKFEGVDFAFFAADEEFTRKHWKTAQQAGAAIVDLSSALEDDPAFPVRAPWVEHELPLREVSAAGMVAAHPAAVALGLLLLRAHKAVPVRSAVCTVFEPASELGQRAMDELQEQTISLLSLKPVAGGLFDAQAAFNMLPRYGELSVRNLEDVERRILRHLREITTGAVPVPSLVLLQAPIFHAHTISVYLEMEKNISVGDLTQALAGPNVEIARLASEVPTNVRAAGQNALLVSVRRDTARENAFWLWIAADNLRLAALTAAEGAVSLATARKGSLP